MKNCSVHAFLILSLLGSADLMPQAALISDSFGAGLNSQVAATSVGADYALKSGPAKIKVVVTGYSSTPDQTDDTPFITASGKRVKDGIIAANFLKFGARVQIPELYGDKIFVVEDRMHRRFNNRVDIWFTSRHTALKFGKQEVEIVIL